MELPAWLTPHTITVKRLTGNGSKGPVWGPEETTRAMVERKRRRVSAGDNRNVISEATVYTPLAFGDVPPDSLVTLDGEAPRRVLAVTRHEFNAATPNHYEVNLQ